ncbi:MAG: V-type ATP synthase subunit D [Thermoprotei archaeon]|nr:MAG: V-type ATP synthase subunit D [Thermoprotei archaeon]
MAELGVRVTRMELFKLKKRLEVADRARQLLEEKRKILAMELMKYVDKIRELRENVNRSLADLYDALVDAEMLMGKSVVRGLLIPSADRFEIEESSRSTIGISIPVLKLKMTKGFMATNPYSFITTSTKLDEIAGKVDDVLISVVELAEAQATVKRLAEELDKVKRRVNALERIVIPKIQRRIKYIEMRLEEMEREDMFRLKRIKTCLERRRRTGV